MTGTVPPEAWRKSTHSGGSNADCVEVGPGSGLVGVRDSKRRGAGSLSVPPNAWAAFVRDITTR